MDCKEGCTHWWICEGSGGGDVPSTCKHCGAFKIQHNSDYSAQFNNSLAPVGEGSLSNRDFTHYGINSRGSQN